MKSIACAAVLLLLAGIAAAQEAHMRTTPNLGVEMETGNAPMAVLPPHQASPVDLRRESVELNELVQEVQPKLDQASKGVLDKDLLNKLKQIEKLAKKLRGELGN